MSNVMGLVEITAGVGLILAGCILLIIVSSDLRSIRRDIDDEGRTKSGMQLTLAQVWRKRSTFEYAPGMEGRVSRVRFNHWAGMALVIVGFGLVLFRPG